MDQFKEITSEFKINGLVDESSTGDLQRTEEWFEARKGRFTGSKIKDLMSCGRSTAKLPWGDAAKTFDFGAAAEKYIYNVGKERLTGLRSMPATSKQLSHGTENEPYLIKQLIKDGLISDFRELSFEQFPTYSNGGASVDGLCVYKGELVALELKCCVSWDGNYKRMYEKVHDKHDDFWQFQSEMLATGVNKVLYVATHPMTVEHYDFDIVQASEIHQKELLKRCKIADKAIELWDKYGYKEALKEACKGFKEEIN